MRKMKSGEQISYICLPLPDGISLNNEGMVLFSTKDKYVVSKMYEMHIPFHNRELYWGTVRKKRTHKNYLFIGETKKVNELTFALSYISPKSEEKNNSINIPYFNSLCEEFDEDSIYTSAILKGVNMLTEGRSIKEINDKITNIINNGNKEKDE